MHCRLLRRLQLCRCRLVARLPRLRCPAAQVAAVAVQQVPRQPAVQQVARRLQLAAARRRALARRRLARSAGIQRDEQVGLSAAGVGRHRQLHPL